MNLPVPRFVRTKLPALVWAGVIFILSSVPSGSIPKLFILSYDKLIHATIFFILGLFVYQALEPTTRSPLFDWKRAVMALVIVVLYGGLDEFHQHFIPGRTPDINDAMADAFGGLISVVASYFLARLRLVKVQRKTPK